MALDKLQDIESRKLGSLIEQSEQITGKLNNAVLKLEQLRDFHRKMEISDGPQSSLSLCNQNALRQQLNQMITSQDELIQQLSVDQQIALQFQHKQLVRLKSIEHVADKRAQKAEYLADQQEQSATDDLASQMSPLYG